MMSGVGLRGLSRAEVRAFGELYRRAAADLAIARSETSHPKLINYRTHCSALNCLIISSPSNISR